MMPTAKHITRLPKSDSGFLAFITQMSKCMESSDNYLPTPYNNRSTSYNYLEPATNYLATPYNNRERAYTYLRTLNDYMVPATNNCVPANSYLLSPYNNRKCLSCYMLAANNLLTHLFELLVLNCKLLINIYLYAYTSPPYLRYHPPEKRLKSQG